MTPACMVCKKQNNLGFDQTGKTKTGTEHLSSNEIITYQRPPSLI